MILAATTLCLFGLGALMGAVLLSSDEDGNSNKDAYRRKTQAAADDTSLPFLPAADPSNDRAIGKKRAITKPNHEAPKVKLLKSKAKPASNAESTSKTSRKAGEVALSVKGSSSLSTIKNSHKFPNRDYSMELDGAEWADFAETFDQAPEPSSGMSYTAWVHLDPRSSDETEMRTVFANRKAGCEINSEAHGFAMFINEWQTNDRSLHVEFGTATEGCVKMATPPGVVPLGKWTQVGLVLDADQSSPGSTDVYITVNGDVRAHSSVTRGGVRSAQHLRIGAHVDGQGFFKGNISEFVVWSRCILDESRSRTTPETQGRLVAGNKPLQGNENQLLAYYPLDWSHVDQGSAGRAERKKAEDFSSRHHKAADVLLPKSSAGLGATSLVTSLGAEELSHLSTDTASSMDWTPEELAAGTYPDHVSEELLQKSDQISKKRALAVKAAMQHSWNNYKQRAWGFDELKPQSGRGQNNWGGMGVTLLDSLDTLWLMGMKEEFNEAAEWVASKLNFNIGRTVSTFETTIRSLGGLLSAYDMSGNRVFLNKALDLGQRLFKAFSTPSGIPVGQVNLMTGAGHNAAWTSSASVLAEIGTLQVEFRYLAEVTGKKEFFTKATQVFETVRKNNAMSDGLAPIYVSPQSGRFTTSRVTFGALGDSWYEYLLKCWIQGGKTEGWLRDMYDKSMDGMVNKLLKRSHPSNLAYVSDWDGSRNTHKMDHLVCFLPGILALGAYTKPDSPNHDRDMILAKSLMYTCYQMYARTSTGIAPEYVDFPGGSDLVPAGRAPFYILRPETAESLFVLHQITVSKPSLLPWSGKLTLVSLMMLIYSNTHVELRMNQTNHVYLNFIFLSGKPHLS